MLKSYRPDIRHGQETSQRAGLAIGPLFCLIFLFWTLSFAFSLWYTLNELEWQAVEFARIQARASFEKDVMYRRWNAMQGGVMAPVVPGKLEPNPYLSPAGRDITGTDGILYTKINPASMTRLVHELGASAFGIQGHLTSNRPIRKGNEPDPWESAALKRLEDGGAEEVSSLETMNGAKYLRLIRPLMVEKSCLSCHAFQGYTEGQVRGGISISVPMAFFSAARHKAQQGQIFAHLILWALGTCGIAAAAFRISRNMKKRERLEALLHDEITLRNAAVREAQTASIAKSDFLARMSHEMRTPMNAIIGMTAIAKSPSADPEKKDYCLSKVEEASRHLLGVINDVLDMSKIEANKFELFSEEFFFAENLQKAMDFIDFPVYEKRQNLTVSIDPRIPPVLVGDEQRLAQVVTNLLSNAVKFTPEEGSIHVEARLEEVDEDGMHTLRVSVKDSGIGISAEQQANLFSSFFQADGGIARKFGGTGLGLAISKKIVEMMGGHIRVESEPGQGAAFIFTVRLMRGGDRRPEPLKEETPDCFEGACLLLVEDVDINREIVKSLLEPTRVLIECAKDGKEAVRMFCAAPERYDLIFMDIQMPEMDGYEATRRIRKLDCPSGRETPIVAMTANVFREDAERCLEAGMQGHISKPLDIQKVMSVLRQYLKKRTPPVSVK